MHVEELQQGEDHCGVECVPREHIHDLLRCSVGMKLGGMEWSMHEGQHGCRDGHGCHERCEPHMCEPRQQESVVNMRVGKNWHAHTAPDVVHLCLVQHANLTCKEHLPHVQLDQEDLPHHISPHTTPLRLAHS